METALRFLILIFVGGSFFLGGVHFGRIDGEVRLLDKQVVSAQALADNIVRGAELKDITDNLGNHPFAIDIIKCESSYNPRAFNLQSRDVGYFQINEYWHKEKALLEGYDINNPQDNLKYGLKLLSETNGLKYWIASEHCWRKL